MAFANIDGIKTHYEIFGNGTPLLMLAPAGFDASMSRWRLNGVWKEMQPLDTLARDFKLIAYDRRETGESGGRVEPLDWPLYAQHAVDLLDHLEIRNAYVIGGCMGCSVALTIGALFPQRCRALLLHWPVGGYRFMLKGRGNFDKHIAYAKENGLQGVVERAKKSKVFWNDPESGPWSAVIGADAAFADAFAQRDLDRYLALVAQSRDTLFHDTMPSGATGEQLMRIDVPAFIMSGDDASHATSAAHTLRELMPKAKMSPLMPPQQNVQTVKQWIMESTAA